MGWRDGYKNEYGVKSHHEKRMSIVAIADARYPIRESKIKVDCESLVECDGHQVSNCTV